MEGELARILEGRSAESNGHEADAVPALEKARELRMQRARSRRSAAVAGLSRCPCARVVGHAEHAVNHDRHHGIEPPFVFSTGPLAHSPMIRHAPVPRRAAVAGA